jgi:hypothetical protein
MLTRTLRGLGLSVPSTSPSASLGASAKAGRLSGTWLNSLRFPAQSVCENLCRPSGTPSVSHFTQDLRPGLTYFAPPGLVSANRRGVPPLRTERTLGWAPCRRFRKHTSGAEARADSGWLNGTSELVPAPFFWGTESFATFVIPRPLSRLGFCGPVLAGGIGTRTGVSAPHANLRVDVSADNCRAWTAEGGCPYATLDGRGRASPHMSAAPIYSLAASTSSSS